MFFNRRPRSASRRAKQDHRLASRRPLRFENLEDRRVLSTNPTGLLIADWAETTLNDLPVATNTEYKPQSKTWQYDDAWWAVFAEDSGTWLYKLEGTAWQQQLLLTTETEINADVKADGDLAHILLFDGPQSQLATLEYFEQLGSYRPWSIRPELVDITLDVAVEVATLDIDSTGRIWIASDATTTVEVRYADVAATSFSGPITIGTGIDKDDISVITALPNGTIGVLWSNQSAEQFGFRIHVDGTDPSVWLADEIPAADTTGGGVADDHLNVAVASDGTLYAAIKTSYDTSGKPSIGLLVRRPDGQWDPLYNVDNRGTRPIVMLNELENRLVVIYTETTGGDSIVMRETALDTIAFSSKQTIFSGNLNHVTSSKQNFTDELIIFATQRGDAVSTLLEVDPSSPPIDENPGPTTPGEVSATVETGEISGADDSAIWIHPTDSSLSRIIGTNKYSSNGLIVYDLAGNEIQVVAAGKTNNVDVRYGFSLTGQSVDIVAAGSRSDDNIVVYKVDPTTGQLANVAARTIKTGISVYGFAMYHSPITGKFYAIVNSKSGKVEQWELFDDGAGKVDATLVRAFDVGSQVEGMVADDELGHLYIGEEEVGIWKYGAEPDSGTARTQVDVTGSGGHLTADVEGLTIYYASSGAGYLLASSQGSDEFVIYEREGNNPYVGTFEIVAGNGIDRVTDTDGIDVTSVPLGSNFPQGVFVAQDNDVNYKLVPWQWVAQSIGPDVTIDVTWNPRDTSDPPVEINQPPVVTAGSDRTIELSESATLSGSFSDDGLPNPAAAVSVQWTLDSGPGTATFTAPHFAATSVSFSQVGTYVLRLTANDGELSASDTMTVTVSADTPPSAEPVTAIFQNGVNGYQGTIDTYILTNSANTAYGSAASLEVDGSPDSSALIKWDVSAVPTGSQVSAATITLDVTNRSGNDYELYELLRTWSEDDATWNQAASGSAWQSSGAQGSQDRGSTSLGTVSAASTGTYTISLNATGLAAVQSWIDDAASNNGVIIQNYVSATNGVDFQSSEAGNVAKRPRLEITYTTEDVTGSGDPPPTEIVNQPPVVSAGSDRTIELSESATLSGGFTDDGLPSPPAAVSVQWTLDSGPGTAIFTAPQSATTSVSFTQVGTYVLRLTANDGELSASDTMMVTVSADTPPSAEPVTAVFQNGVNGYQGTVDTYILTNSANTAYGSAATLEVDGSPASSALIKWDVSAVPTGSQVSAATITLDVTNRSGNDYELYELLRTWSEDDATWNQAGSGSAWQSSGAQGSQDRGSTSLGTVSAASTGTYTISLNATGLAAVQSWIDDAASNYGVIIQNYVSATNGVDFQSSEAGNVAKRPQLEITYTTTEVTGSDDPPPTEVDNQPPVVSAGSDRTIQLSESATLSGSFTDDGLPNPPATVSVQWTLDSGPGTATFTAPQSAATSVSFTQVGTYVLRLTANDGELSASDLMQVIVEQDTPTTLDTGLVGRWRLDTTGPTLPDASATANDATVSGDPQSIAGQVGTAISLDGNDYAVVADDPSLDSPTAITISAWIQPSRSGTQYFVKKADKSAVDGYELGLSSSGTVFVRFNQASSRNTYRVNSSSSYPTSGNAWMHVAATYDGSTIRLYINGVLESSKNADFNIGSNSLGLYLGSGNGGYRAMSGGLDDVRLYDRALTTVEVQQLAAL